MQPTAEWTEKAHKVYSTLRGTFTHEKSFSLMVAYSPDVADWLYAMESDLREAVR